MSVVSFFNQSGTLYPKSSYNAQGREVLGTGVAIRGRLQGKSRNVKAQDGSILTIVGTYYVPASTLVNIDDKITIDGNSYKVFSKYAVPDGRGTINHIKLDLLLWQI